MSNETMPEKISPCPFCGSEKLDVRYQLIICENCGAEGPVFDDSGEIYQNPKGSAVAWNNRQGEGETELRRQNAALKAFANVIMSSSLIHWDGLDEKGCELGLLNKVVREDGSVRFDKADWMLTATAAMPAPSKAEVAREFIEAVKNRLFAHRMLHGVGLNPDYAVECILKEWEDAKSK